MEQPMPVFLYKETVKGTVRVVYLDKAGQKDSRVHALLKKLEL